jgi:murein DD-endopeptidase MepM/ murein hydrolase activator NlpD
MTNNIQNQYLPVVGDYRISDEYWAIRSGNVHHKGIDFARANGGASIQGRPIIATRDGKIELLRYESDGDGFGNRIAIKSGNDPYLSRYGHLEDFAINPKTGLQFKQGDTVQAGDVIGYVGSTGRSTGPHLHYEESYIDSNGEKTSRQPDFSSSKQKLLDGSVTTTPTSSFSGAFNTVIDFFSSTATSISDFFKNFNSEVQGIVNTNPFVTAKVGNPNFLIGFNQESSYTVKSGDSLSKIATDNNTTVDKILEANPNIENPNLINVGDSIIIPKIVEQHSFNAFSGDKSIQLASSGMIATDAVYVDSDGNPTSVYDSLFKTEDSNGNKVTFVREGTEVKTKDGSFVSLAGIINTIDSATSSLMDFISRQIDGIFEPIFKELFGSDDSTKDESGNNAAQRLAGKILADLLEGKDITDIAQDQVNTVLIQNLLSDASKKLAAAIPTGPLGADSTSVANDNFSRNNIKKIIGL